MKKIPLFTLLVLIACTSKNDDPIPQPIDLTPPFNGVRVSAQFDLPAINCQSFTNMKSLIISAYTSGNSSQVTPNDYRYNATMDESTTTLTISGSNELLSMEFKGHLNRVGTRPPSTYTGDINKWV